MATRKKRTTKAARKTRRKPTPKKTAATSKRVKRGKLGKWMPAKRVRVRRVAGQLQVDIEK